MGRSFDATQDGSTKGKLSLWKWGRKVPYTVVKDGSLGFVNGNPIAASYDAFILPTPWTPGRIKITESAYDLTKNSTMAHEWQHARDKTQFWTLFMYLFDRDMRHVWFESRATIAAAGVQTQGPNEWYITAHTRLIASSYKKKLWEVEKLIQHAMNTTTPVTKVNWK